MKKFLSPIFNVRREELGITALMLANYYLLLVTYYFLKPARDSLFLFKVSSEQLPMVFILTAVVTVPIITIYARASKKLKLNQLINATLAIVIANLFILRYLIQLEGEWIYYLFYTWVSIYGALVTAQFWLLANAVYDVTQAKRIFPLISLAGILGAFTGGYITSVVVETFGVSTENLLMFCVGFLVCSMGIVAVIFRKEESNDVNKLIPKKRKKEDKSSTSQLFKTIGSSRQLKLMVGIVAMTMMVASFVDYQFKVVSKESYPSKEELTAFLGIFYGGLSMVSFFFQFAFTGHILRYLGVGGVLLFLPVGLFFGSGAMLLFPGLLSAILLRGSDGALKYSLDKTARELLFLPIPLTVKKKTKMFIDIFVDRWFRGLAGGLLLLCTLVLKLSVQQISVVVLLFILIWVVLVLAIRKEYVNSFRIALERREIDLSDLRVNVSEANTMKHLVTAIESGNDQQVIYALDLLKYTHDVDLTVPLTKLLQSKNPEIRCRAIEALKHQGEPEENEIVKTLITDRDPSVRREAVAFCRERWNEDGVSALSEFLTHDDYLVQMAAIDVVAMYGDEEEKKLVSPELITQLLSLPQITAAERAGMAIAIGTLPQPLFKELLLSFTRDHEPVVRKAAVSAISTTVSLDFVPLLLKELGNRENRIEARKSLASYGEAVLEDLNRHFEDSSTDKRVKSQIPRVLGEIAAQRSVELLISWLDNSTARLKRVIIRALNRLRSKHDHLKFDPELLRKSVASELRLYYETLTISAAEHTSDATPQHQLLKRSINEKLNSRQELLFRILGLIYPPNDIFNAYQGLRSPQRYVRSSAVEFLDNLLKGFEKKYFLPIVNDESVTSTIELGSSLVEVPIESRADVLRVLMRGDDPWLKACAIFSYSPEEEAEVTRIVEAALKNENQIVREAASLVLQK